MRARRVMRYQPYGQTQWPQWVLHTSPGRTEAGTYFELLQVDKRGGMPRMLLAGLTDAAPPHDIALMCAACVELEEHAEALKLEITHAAWRGRRGLR